MLFRLFSFARLLAGQKEIVHTALCKGHGGQEAHMRRDEAKGPFSTLETTRFGAIEIDPESVITFTQPIIGFNDLRRFVFLPGPAGSMVKWLQSAERGDTAFIVLDPRMIYPGYELDLRPEEMAELAIGNVSELDVYSLVVVPEDHSQVRANLKAPILVNPVQRLGKQTILERRDYPIQYFLLRPQASEETGEVAHARADA